MNDVFRYYAGTTTSKTILKDLAKVLATGVKTSEIINSHGEVIRDKQIIIDKNFDVVYPAPIKSSKELIDIMDWDNLTPEEYALKIDNQLSQVTDTVILKTTTTPKDTTQYVDDIGLNEDNSAESVTVYVEMYKPKYLIDTETYNPETERHGILPYVMTKEGFINSISTLGTVSLNMQTDLSGSDAESNIIIDYIEDKGSTSLNILENDTSNYSTIKTLSELLDGTYHVSNNLYQIDNEQETQALKWYHSSYNESVEIPYETFINILDNNDILSQYMNKLFKPSDLNKEYSITLTIDKKELTYRGTIILKWTRQVERWTINEGFSYTVPEGSNVDVTTLAVSYEKNGEESGDLTNKFQIEKDENSVKITCIETIQSNTEYLGSPILYYKYSKSANNKAQKELLSNYNNIFIRIFDTINMNGDGPMENIYDENTGKIIKTNSNVSEWAKLSWYKDFEEVMIDDLDDDISTNTISDGLVNLPLDTPGLNSSTKLNFWINTNNDRAVIVLMGNPSLMFTEERHLISTAYIGAIESFENSINDVTGNFALYTSSSTQPCLSKLVTKKISQNISNVIGVGDSLTNAFSYTITEGEYDNSVSPVIRAEIDGTTTILKKDEGFSIISDTDGKVLTITFADAPLAGTILNLDYAIKVSKTTTEKGVIRDDLGNITTINFPDNFGTNTANGTTDISMLHTSSKAYFQKHHMMFNTTEEFMTKVMYGKSAYTGEFYADRIKVVHGNDGPRGILQGLLAIDSSNLYPFDELIVNKDFSKDPNADEEIYVYFPITAPFSPFAGSPNSRFGIAIKKSYTVPDPIDDNGILEYAENEIYSIVGNFKGLTNDIYVPKELKYGATVSWESSNTTSLSFSDDRENILGSVTRPVYGGGDSEFTVTATISVNKSTKTITFDASVKEGGMSDTQRVAHDKAELGLLFNKDSVTGDVELQTLGSAGCTITWTSSNEEVMNGDGKVNRPTNGSSSSTITLTATIAYNSSNDTKEFTVTVLPWTDEEEVEYDVDNLTWDTIKGINTVKTEVMYDLVLPTTGTRNSTIEWTSSNADAIATDGTVTRPAYKLGDVYPVLQATITKGTFTKKVVFSGIRVLKMPITNVEAATISVSSLEPSDFIGSNTSINEITTTFSLPSRSTEKDCSTVTFSWSIIGDDDEPTTSSYGKIDGSTGEELFVVTRPTSTEDNAIIKLKVVSNSSKLAGSTASSYKVFQLTILKEDAVLTSKPQS